MDVYVNSGSSQAVSGNVIIYTGCLKALAFNCLAKISLEKPWMLLGREHFECSCYGKAGLVRCHILFIFVKVTLQIV